MLFKQPFQMTEPIASSSATDPCDAAAYWFARHSSGRMSDAEHQQFAQWRKAHPDHDLEYRRAQGIQIGMSRISPERLRQLTREPEVAELNTGRRRFAFGLGLACTATISAGIVWFMRASSVVTDFAHFTTAIGEQSRHTMPDQTLININTATNLYVDYYEDRRVARLVHGEAMFSVSPSERKPFYVMAGDTTIRVTGTRFNVIYENDRTSVAVASGRVEVSQGSWWRRKVLVLEAGQAVQSLPESGLSSAQKADMNNVLAWEQGRIVFDNIPLDQALIALNRYRQFPLTAAASVRQLRIAGVFNPYSQSAFLDLLPKMLPVRIESQRDGTVQILPR